MVAIWALQAGGGLSDAAVVLLSAGVGYGISRAQASSEAAAEFELRLASDKRFLYKLYTDLVRNVLENKDTQDRRTQKLILEMRRFVFGSMINASDGVVLAHNRFLRAANLRAELVLPAMADVILEMRRDAGMAETKLKPVTILASFVNDIEDHPDLLQLWEKQKGDWSNSPNDVVALRGAGR